MKQKICLIGAGNIANSHFDALSAMPNVAISAIVDPNIRAAEALAAKSNDARVFTDLSEALKTRDFDRAHILVPPPFHEDVALELINEGVSVLCEKPLATDSEACRGLVSQAAEKNVVLAVNQNGIFDPAYLKLLDTVQSGAVGELRHVHCFFNVPLRQLAANQMGHWMFNQPMNILLEQAVHPLSQILDLIGDVTNISAHAPSGSEFSPGTMFFSSCSITLQGKKAGAQLHFAVGREYPFWQISAVCDDGVVVADLVSNRTYTHGRTRLPDFANAFFCPSSNDLGRVSVFF